MAPPPQPQVSQSSSLLLPTATKKHDGGLFGKRRVVVLGIDSSLTGWAVTALSTEDDTHFSWKYTSKHQGALRLYDMVAFIENRIESTRLQTGGVERIVMEGYGFASMKASAIGEIGGITKYLLLKLFGYSKPVGYPYYAAPNQLKKYVTGSGSVEIKKEQVLLQTYKRWGVEFNDNDLCDSFCCAQMARALGYASKAELPVFQQEVLTKLVEQTEWPPLSLKMSTTPTK